MANIIAKNNGIFFVNRPKTKHPNKGAFVLEMKRTCGG
jgi:hypothetical protein